jgi:hypothetical protein
VRAVLENQSGLEDEGLVRVSCMQHPALAAASRSSWRDVLEMAIPLRFPPLVSGGLRLRVGIGRGGVVQHLLPSRAPVALGTLRS